MKGYFGSFHFAEGFVVCATRHLTPRLFRARPTTSVTHNYQLFALKKGTASHEELITKIYS